MQPGIGLVGDDKTTDNRNSRPQQLDGRKVFTQPEKPKANAKDGGDLVEHGRGADVDKANGNKAEMGADANQETDDQKKAPMIAQGRQP